MHASADGWSPVYVGDSLAVMSIGFLLPDQDDAVIWRGPKKNGLIRQFLTDVTWGDLDVLVIDTPPGTKWVNIDAYSVYIFWTLFVSHYLCKEIKKFQFSYW